MASNWDKNFEMQKVEFKKRFNLDWNTNQQLFLSYIQAVQTYTIVEMINNGLGEVIRNQESLRELIKQNALKK